MKKLIPFIFILFCFPSYAMNMAIMGGGVPASCTTMGNMTVWEKLETVPSTGSWTKVDTASKLSASASGELATLKCPNGTADDGSNGMKYTSGTTSEGKIYYTFGSAQSELSFGFWYKTGTVTSWNTGPYIARICATANCSLGYSDMFLDTRSMGDNSRRLLENPSTTYIDMTGKDNTWVWITGHWKQNDTSSWAVYDSTGTQIGTTQTYTGYNNTAASITFGPTGTSSESLTSDIYWDDIVILTGGTTLLGP